MEVDKELICRLCLKKCCCGFQIIEDTIREILHMLVIDLNLTVSYNPVMCYTCLDSVVKCFDTKANYVQRNDKNVGNKIKNEDVTPIVIISGSSNMCWLCMEPLKYKAPLISLKKVENIAHMLERHFQVILSTTEDLTICMICYESLKHHSIFINDCLTVEKDVRDFYEMKGTKNTGQINLTEVISFMLENKSKSNNGSCSTVEVAKNAKAKQKCYRRSKDGIERDAKIKTTSSPVSAVYKCDICAFQCNRKDGLYQHKRIHKAAPKLYQCEFCTYCTDVKASLRNHMSTHKTAPDVTMHKCEKCPYQVKTKSSLLKHRLTHNSTAEITMYKCKLCTFQATYAAGVQKHMLTHQSTLELTMFKCDMCPFQTKRKGSLKRHMLIHKDLAKVTLHKCELCNFETKHKYNLTNHMITHKSPSEIPMYKCAVCTFATKYKNDLGAHMLTHKDESEPKMYKCEMCPYETNPKHNILRHLRRAHGIYAKDRSEGSFWKLQNVEHQDVIVVDRVR